MFLGHEASSNYGTGSFKYLHEELFFRKLFFRIALAHEHNIAVAFSVVHHESDEGCAAVVNAANRVQELLDRPAWRQWELNGAHAHAISRELDTPTCEAYLYRHPLASTRFTYYCTHCTTPGTVRFQAPLGRLATAGYIKFFHAWYTSRCEAPVSTV